MFLEDLMDQLHFVVYFLEDGLIFVFLFAPLTRVSIPTEVYAYRLSKRCQLRLSISYQTAQCFIGHMHFLDVFLHSVEFFFRDKPHRITLILAFSEVFSKIVG